MKFDQERAVIRPCPPVGEGPGEQRFAAPRMLRTSIVVGLGVALLLSRPVLVSAETPAVDAAPAAPSFRGDVMPIL
ncbi:MAG TPA: hypothetical protein VMF30_04955, partial [Pirellulales bacterium]|nr:hypothetical protein [Pirellulales bacterium]